MSEEQDEPSEAAGAEGDPPAPLPDPTVDAGETRTPAQEAPIPEPTPQAPPGGRRESPTARLLRGDVAAALQAPFLQPILRFPLRKVAIWGTLLGLLYLAREFFSVILLTFVISYISTTVVGRMHPFIKSRKLCVFLVYAVIVGGLIGLGFSIVPGALKEGKAQIERVKEIKDPKAFVRSRMQTVVKEYPVLEGWGLTERAIDALGDDEAFKGVDWPEILKEVGGVWTMVWKGILNVGVALIFSFMVVWDMPKIAIGMRRLNDSRLSAVWLEVGPSIGTFFRLLGRGFEAQTVIAIINTALTCVGVAVLGIEGIGFLALIVFACSFIPVVGVFMSTVPICIMGLQGGGGPGIVVAVVVMVTLIHLIEAYILNPRIYGHHMRLHPLAVLVVLYIAQALVGVWGLVVGVPLATYIWRHLIMREAQGPALGDEPSEEAIAAPA